MGKVHKNPIKTLTTMYTWHESMWLFREIISSSNGWIWRACWEQRGKEVLDHEGGLCHINESRFYQEGNWESLDNIKEENDVILSAAHYRNVWKVYGGRIDSTLP